MVNDLKLTVHQMAPILGDVEGNKEEVRARVGESMDRDLLVFPELTLTGYSLRSRVQRLAAPLGEKPPVALPEGSPPVAMGVLERGADELVYNSALIFHQGRILTKHRKIYLPTYGLFDEGRYFAPGKGVPPVATLPGGWKVGLLLCEDSWHPGLLYLLAMQGADVILVLAAAPGRGDPEGSRDRAFEDSAPQAPGGAGVPTVDPAPGPLFSSTANWTLLARAAAMQYGLFVVIANRAGVEEGVTFAGGSVAVGPDGGILAAAPQAEAATLDMTFNRQALRSARNPYAHLRDEDPAYLRRALDRIMEGSMGPEA